jgi:dienelactone hydrolase
MQSVATHAGERHLQRRQVDAFVWIPDADAAARWPVVVFSHGLFECANQSRFITEGIAAAGYLVIAPNHADAICSVNREARDEPS